MSDSDPIYAPRPNTATKVYTQRIPVTAASAATAIAANLAKTGWVSFKAVGGSIDFTVSEAGGVLVKDAAGSGTTVGYTLTDGQERDFWVALTGAAGFVTAIASANCNLLLTRAGKERINAAGL
jgi:hypothetical protein